MQYQFLVRSFLRPLGILFSSEEVCFEGLACTPQCNRNIPVPAIVRMEILQSFLIFCETIMQILDICVRSFRVKRSFCCVTKKQLQLRKSKKITQQISFCFMERKAKKGNTLNLLFLR